MLLMVAPTLGMIAEMSLLGLEGPARKRGVHFTGGVSLRT
jgi:hypothetical protein